MTYEINHWHCSLCGRELTRVEPDENGESHDYDEVLADIHFDITRSKKTLFLDNGEIEENIIERNVKMERILCKECFDDILTESPAFRKLFLIDGKVIY